MTSKKGTPLWKALLFEGRLPWRYIRKWDGFCNLIGLRFKVVKNKGLKIKIRRLSTDENHIYNVIETECYNPSDYEINEDDIVIDIGGNIGTFSILAASHAKKGKVFSFEPMPDNYNLLKENIRLNRVRNIYPACFGVLDKKKRVEFFINSKDTGGHSINEISNEPRNKKIIIKCIALKDIFDKNNIKNCNFLKLDCEGAEYPILLNLPKEYFKKIDKIAMEYHTKNYPSPAKTKEVNILINHLKKMGFSVDKHEDFEGYRCGFIFANRKNE